MQKVIDSISVFFPVYNEQENIENTVNSAIKVLNEIAGGWEIIIVNDGSTDNSLEISERLSRKYSNVRVISHDKNIGYGASLRTGFYNSKYPLQLIFY